MSECKHRPAMRVWEALGRSVGQVARNLGVSPTTVRRYLNADHKREVA